MDDLTDERILRRTFGLAKLAKNRGNGAFGAILAKDGVVLFEGENTVAEGEGDLTRHAEMNALREASLHYDKAEFKRFTLYCSTEPCAMCAAAAHLCGVGRVVYGFSNERMVSLDEATLPVPCREIFSRVPESAVLVVGPLLTEEAGLVHGLKS